MSTLDKRQQIYDTEFSCVFFKPSLSFAFCFSFTRLERLILKNSTLESGTRCFMDRLEERICYSGSGKTWWAYFWSLLTTTWRVIFTLSSKCIYVKEARWLFLGYFWPLGKQVVGFFFGGGAGAPGSIWIYLSLKPNHHCQNKPVQISDTLGRLM